MTGYRTILADPPWAERGGGRSVRGAQRHYELMTTAEIRRLAVDELASTDGCLLWLWATANHLPDALEVMAAWGFDYVTNLTWVKGRRCHVCDGTGEELSEPVDSCGPCNGTGLDTGTPGALQLGLGQYVRMAHEHLLVGRRGDVDLRPQPERRWPSVLVAERFRHSGKPLNTYETIEVISPKPHLELFARDRRPGWDVWGRGVASDVEVPVRGQQPLALE